MKEQLKIMSYGGGVQSTACLVLAAQGKLDIKTFLFANVGDDSENPATIRYVREVAIPFAQAHGLVIIELCQQKKNGERETLYQHVTKPSQKMEIIPVRLTTINKKTGRKSGKPGMRACTTSWKIRVIGQWMRKHGASKANPGSTALGISMDEWQRMRTSDEAYRVNIFPLIERRMDRQDCVNVIQRAGLEVPPKSSCWFCPFHRMSTWQAMADHEPDLFAKAVEMEATINARREKQGKDAVYFTDKLIPLNRAVGDMTQGDLWEGTEPTCDSGFCFM